MDTPWLTPDEAADRLRMSRSTFDRMVRKNHIPRHYLPTGRVRYHRDDVDALVGAVVAVEEAGTSRYERYSAVIDQIKRKYGNVKPRAHRKPRSTNATSDTGK